MVVCHNCDTELSEQAKFCPECGLTRAINCKQCGTGLPVTAKFCIECGISQAIPVDRQADVDSSTPQVQSEHTGQVFILPGAEVWFGMSYGEAQHLGVTKKVNRVAIDRQDKGQIVLRPSSKVLSSWSYPQTRGRELEAIVLRGSANLDPIGGAIFQGEFFPESRGQIFLSKASLVANPDQDEKIAALTTNTENALDVTAGVFTRYGWARSSSATGSFQLQKSSVNGVAAAFLFLLGIVPGLLYLMVQQGKPAILDVRLEHLERDYSGIYFVPHRMSASELEGIVSEVQTELMPKN